MKQFFRLLSLSLMFVRAIIAQETELDKFFKKYMVPLHIKNYLDESFTKNCFEILKWGKILKDPCSGYYLKVADDDAHSYDDAHSCYDFGRVINAERLRVAIEECCLTCFDVPKKYIYFNQQDGPILARPIKNTFFVVAEGMDCVEINGASWTRQEINQLVLLIFITGYWDLHPGNIKRRKSDGKLVIIDTEDEAFAAPFYDPIFDREGCFARWINFFSYQNFASKNIRYIDKHRKLCNEAKEDSSFRFSLTIPFNVDFDKKVEIDLRQVQLQTKRAGSKEMVFESYQRAAESYGIKVECSCSYRSEKEKVISIMPNKSIIDVSKSQNRPHDCCLMKWLKNLKAKL